MTNTQVETSFGRDSTAADVLRNVDLRGRFAVVTGGYSGLGLETTRSLVGAGAEVLVPARRPSQAEQQLGGIAEVSRLDLTDTASVRRQAAQLVERGRPVDILIHGAGIMTRNHTRVGPGWEAHLAVHHLGPHLLTKLLAPLLASEARVVGTSSAGHFLSDVRWDDPHFERGDEYDQWVAYGQSKTAVALAARYFDAELSVRGARAYSVHPGSILTPLQREVPEAEQRRLGWVDENGRPPEGFKTAAQGAATIVWAATSPLLATHGGAYLQDCNIALPATTDDMLIGGAKPWVQDPDRANRLHTLTEQMLMIGR